MDSIDWQNDGNTMRESMRFVKSTAAALRNLASDQILDQQLRLLDSLPMAATFEPLALTNSWSAAVENDLAFAADTLVRASKVTIGQRLRTPPSRVSLLAPGGETGKYLASRSSAWTSLAEPPSVENHPHLSSDNPRQATRAATAGSAGVRHGLEESYRPFAVLESLVCQRSNQSRHPHDQPGTSALHTLTQAAFSHAPELSHAHMNATPRDNRETNSLYPVSKAELVPASDPSSRDAQLLTNTSFATHSRANGPVEQSVLAQLTNALWKASRAPSPHSKSKQRESSPATNAKYSANFAPNGPQNDRPPASALLGDSVRETPVAWLNNASGTANALGAETNTVYMQSGTVEPDDDELIRKVNSALLEQAWLRGVDLS